MPELESDSTAALRLAFESALDFLGSIDRAPVGTTVTIEELRARLDRQLGNTPLDASAVIADLLRDVRGGLLNSAGGRFFAWVIGGAMPAALAADWLTSTWDQNAAISATGPAAGVVEEVAGRWLKQLLRLPETASFAFVTGTQMAHVTALASARHALLARRGWDIEAHGLTKAPQLRVISNSDRHASVDRALRLLGIGRDQVTLIPSDSNGQLSPRALHSTLSSNPKAPTIVVLQAGEINTGAFDAFAELVPIAKDFDSWVHVDGAFGLWASASSQYRSLCRGVDTCDSWTTDGHKLLNVPFDSGYAFVADAEAHRAAMSIRAPYIAASTDGRDEIDWNPEWSRRARGFATYAALRQLGRRGVAEIVERCAGHARELVDRIGSLKGAQVLVRPVFNQGLVHFCEHTERVIAAVNRSGEAFFGATTWRGIRAMRISVVNWRTTGADIARTIDAVTRAAAE